MVGSNITKVRHLLSMFVWVLFFMLLLPMAGFDVDILYTLTFFGLIFFIIYKFSSQVNELFIGEQFRLIQLVLQRRVGTGWLLKIGNTWSSARIGLVTNTVTDLLFYYSVMEAQSISIAQLSRNIVDFVYYHKLIVANLVSLRPVWTRISYGAIGKSYRLHQPENWRRTP